MPNGNYRRVVMREAGRHPATIARPPTRSATCRNFGARSAIESQMAEDLEALVFVRIPQFPSSRAYGYDPVLSLSEYQKRAPANRADWKIVPVGPRDFPASMKNPLAPKERSPQSVTATYVWAAGALCLTGSVFMAWKRRRQKVRSRTDV